MGPSPNDMQVPHTVRYRGWVGPSKKGILHAGTTMQYQGLMTPLRVQ